MNIFKSIYLLLSDFSIYPLEMITRLRGIPYYLANLRLWSKENTAPSFQIRLSELRFLSWERFASAGGTRGHYFHQDLWVASDIYRLNIRSHVDVGSRLDGFIAHLLPFCSVTFVDLRPLNLDHVNFNFIQGTITNLPFKDSSISSLSCLHVIEHIGLGRYGDTIDPEGFRKAANELVRVLAPGGRLFLSTPVGVERLVFDAHRIFDPLTVVETFAPAKLASFHLISDAGDRMIPDASFAEARRCKYGCGIFVFQGVAK